MWRGGVWTRIAWGVISWRDTERESETEGQKTDRQTDTRTGRDIHVSDRFVIVLCVVSLQNRQLDQCENRSTMIWKNCCRLLSVLIIDYWSGECYLTPHQHGAKDDLQAIKEVVSNQDDGRSSCCPALTGTDGFDTGSGCWTGDTETLNTAGTETHISMTIDLQEQGCQRTFSETPMWTHKLPVTSACMWKHHHVTVNTAFE